MNMENLLLKVSLRGLGK